MVAMNLVGAKAKRCVLNVSPAGCGKSSATDTIAGVMGTSAMKYTSLTLAGLKQISNELNQFNGHVVIDDLGGEKSEWSRVSTVTVLANLVYTHFVKKITQGCLLEVTGFYGSAALNIQPVLMQSIVGDNDWISVIRDKVIVYYHLIRPIKPVSYLPNPKVNWDMAIQEVAEPRHRGKLWYQLVAIGLAQWSYGRVLEHIPMLLRACAALDGRSTVSNEDYRILAKLLMPMQMGRYVVDTFSFESGRSFNNNLFCMLVEIASHGEPSIDTICEDYKVSPSTVLRIAQELSPWVWVKANSPKKICPMDLTKQIFQTTGVNQKW
jgi:hypothetical protein